MYLVVYYKDYKTPTHLRGARPAPPPIWGVCSFVQMFSVRGYTMPPTLAKTMPNCTKIFGMKIALANTVPKKSQKNLFFLLTTKVWLV